MSHRLDRCSKVRMQAGPHSRIDCRPEAGGFIKLRFAGRQPENIGGELQGGTALASPSGNPQRGNRGAASPFDALFAIPQGVSQTLQNRAIQMCARVDVTEADDGALGFRARHFQPGSPIGLQHQSHRARRNRFHQPIKQHFWLDALSAGFLLFGVAEFVFKPVDHPISPVYLNFGRVIVRHSRRIGW